MATTQQWGRVLFAGGFDVFALPDLSRVLPLAHTRRIDLMVVRAPDASNEHILRLMPAWRSAHAAPVVLISRRSSEQLLLAALRAGISDYLHEPVSGDELLSSVRRLLAEPGRPGDADGQEPRPAIDPIVGESRAIRDVRGYVERVARTDSTVLITGETGVGKELVAGMIHAASPRNHRPCVSINCAAIPDTLLESELFGVERGAFTGADRPRAGTLKAADGGSVFFDEIGDMGLVSQAKILRAIETREVHPLGGGLRVPLDVRVIAATNQDLEALVGEGRFRKDLFYRLNVARIHLPPLRQRLDDLEPILQYYIEQLNRRFNRDVRGLTPHALEQLRRHDWPGNIRELKNLLEAMFVNLDGQRVDVLDLPPGFHSRLVNAPDVSQSERARLLDVLLATNWNKSKAAEELKWSRMTLYRKLAKYQVIRDRKRA